MTLIKKLEQQRDSYFKHHKDYGYRDFEMRGWGVEKAIEIVEEHSDWVSVDERLPSDGDIVEVYRDSYKWGDLVWQCLYTDKHGFRNYPEGTVGKNDKITHWRPIQLPSEVQNETQ